MHTISILLIDRTQADIEHMSQCLSGNPAFRIAGCCTSVRQAYAMMQLSHPDVVVCEMFLNGPDGMELLERMPRNGVRPLFLMTSSFTSDCILENAARFGADYFIRKPIEPERLAHTILMLARQQPHPEVHEVERALMHGIQQLLISEGFSSRYQGFHFLATALELIYKEPGMMSSLSKLLYAQIARIHDTLPSRVERDIRHAIHCVCEHSDVPPLSNGTMLRYLLRKLLKIVPRK